MCGLLPHAFAAGEAQSLEQSAERPVGVVSRPTVRAFTRSHIERLGAADLVAPWPGSKWSV